MSTPAVENAEKLAPEPPPKPAEFHVMMLDTQNAYGVKKGSFLYSSLLNGLALVLLVVGSHWTFTHRDEIGKAVVQLTTDMPEDLVFKMDKQQSGGGGGGGDRDKLQAPKGALPKTSRDLPLAPPMVVVRNEKPKLEVEPSVVAPNLPFPNQGNMGDPLSKIVGTISNGTGSGGGIGSGSGGGVGSGNGPGVGPGWGGGYGGGLYRVGGGVSAPKVLFNPDPEYSEEARKAKYQGVVALSLIVGPDGRTHDIRVSRSLGMGLDEKAIESVKTWKFEPAKKDGKPVAVAISIEVNFRLY